MEVKTTGRYNATGEANIRQGRKKEKTLAGMFLKYVALFCTNTILLAAGVFVLMLCAASAGFLLPANYAETELSKNGEQIRKAGGAIGQWIPQGCTYGVYNGEGGWQIGTFPLQEQKSAWKHFAENSIYAEYKGYYRFIPQDNGNVCIVKYHLFMRYANEKFNQFLLAPEVLMPVLDLILFIVNAVLLSRGFAKNVKGQLRELGAITEKIAGNNLEFETKTSDIKEINEVMASFGRMKDTLQDSLKAQWDMEKQKQEQLAALAHDVKTPLTIIRGNAELLKEGELSEENQECAAYILANADEIEKYLETMKQVLHGIRQGEEQEVFSCEELAETLGETAKQLAAAKLLPAVVEAELSEGAVYRKGVIRCKEADILRAWNNIVGNAAEYTNQQRGVAISIRTGYREDQWYLTAAVRDYGPGFSPKDLQYADKEFYSGDASRHDRRHSGLGLSIAKKFAEEQGGFLAYGNCEDGEGAEAALWLSIEDDTGLRN